MTSNKNVISKRVLSKPVSKWDNINFQFNFIHKQAKIKNRLCIQVIHLWNSREIYLCRANYLYDIRCEAVKFHFKYRKLIIFKCYFKYKDCLPACMSVHYMCDWWPQMLEEDVRFPRNAGNRTWIFCKSI